MKRVDFNSKTRRWDTYKAFHVHTEKGFVQFETGEIIGTRNKFDPHERGYHKDHEVYIVHPDDGVLDFYSNDGEKIPTAQLTQTGNPVLMFDPQFGVAVRIGYRYDSSQTDVEMATHLRGATVYSFSDKHPPQGTRHIKVSVPFVATKEQKEWLKETGEYAKIMFELIRGNERYWISGDKALVQVSNTTLTPQEFVDWQAKQTNGLGVLAQAAKHGFGFARVEEELRSINAKLRR